MNAFDVLELEQAAKYLNVNAESLRRKAKNGTVPGRKAGKKWLFIRGHLADWVSGRYPERGRELTVIDGGKQKTTEGSKCQSINAGKRGGLTTPHQTGSEYAKALAPKTKSKRNNSTTK